MTHPSQVSYQTVGSSKARPRLWIEGAKLAAAGFARGARYAIAFADGSMTLSLDPAGPRAVCGKLRNNRDIPVLDIALKELEDQFGTGTRVRVVFMNSRITVTLHHEVAAQIDREDRFRKALATRQLVEASMFTGGGVSTHAIHSAIQDYGHCARLAWVVDADLRYLQAGYAGNCAITDETTALIGRAEEIETAFFRQVDILSFSMPCSGFSKAGRAKHGRNPEAHEGAAALFGTMNAIRAANPAVLISENVAEARGSPAYILLTAELERLGYEIFGRIMDSSDTGSIENRRRYWFIALSRGIAKGFSFDHVHPGAHAPRQQIRDILQDQVPDTAWSSNDYLHEKAARDAVDGKGFVRQLLSGEETTCGTIGRHYNKRRSTEPFLVRADGKERLFTPAEHARIKSAPESLVENLLPTMAHQILGQSVDWRQAYLAMSEVMRHVTGQVMKGATRLKRAMHETGSASSGKPEQLTLI